MTAAETVVDRLLEATDPDDAAAFLGHYKYAPFKRGDKVTYHTEYGGHYYGTVIKVNKSDKVLVHTPGVGSVWAHVDRNKITHRLRETEDPDDPEMVIRHEIDLRSIPIKKVTVYGKRWWRRGPGTTYHSAYIYINDKLIHTIPYSYGYSDQYLWNAFEWLEKHGYIDRTSNEPPWVTAERLGFKLDYEVEDVKRRRDL